MPAVPAARAGAKAGLKGHLVAWDPINQKEVWRAQFDQPWNGGALATAGNLVFQGNSMGELVAYRATNGQKLWSAPTQAIKESRHRLPLRRSTCCHRSSMFRRTPEAP
jgi:outer membrane protein assembly factor BamB